MSRTEETSRDESPHLNPYSSPSEVAAIKKTRKSPVLYVVAMWLGGFMFFVLPFLGTGLSIVTVSLTGFLIGILGLLSYVVNRKGWKAARLLSRVMIWLGVFLFFVSVAIKISGIGAIGFMIGFAGVVAWFVTRAGELRRRT